MLTTSTDINEIASALAKAQGAMDNASKDRSNPAFKSKYADLASVRDATSGPLSANGIAVLQAAATTAEGVTVETRFVHTSGQWFACTVGAVPKAYDPQSIGSAITYLRRYGLMSMAGIAPEDDDGNAASGRDDGPPRWQQRLPLRQPAQSARWRQRAHRIHGHVPARERGQPGQRERRELQPFLLAPGQPVGRRRLDVAAKLRPVRLHQPMGVLLLPEEPTPHEQPLLADRHVLARHHVARQAADVAPVAQDDAGIAVADRAVGAERQRAADAHRWAQRERPWGHQAQKRGACTRRDGV